MAEITFKGQKITTLGALPEVSTVAPAFTLTDTSLTDRSLEDFLGKTLVLNIVPSLDTGICAKSAHKFNNELQTRDDLLLLNISRDLPFAAKRFCQSESLDFITTLSEMRDDSFGKDYGVTMTSGPLSGLLSRAVVIIDPEGKVKYTQQVPEIAQEPDYQSVLAAL